MYPPGLDPVTKQLQNRFKLAILATPAPFRSYTHSNTTTEFIAENQSQPFANSRESENLPRGRWDKPTIEFCRHNQIPYNSHDSKLMQTNTLYSQAPTIAEDRARRPPENKHTKAFCTCKKTKTKSSRLSLLNSWQR